MKNYKNKGIAPPRYDAEFKAGAVRLVAEQNRPVAQVAQELGVCVDSLRNWIKAAGAGGTSPASVPGKDTRMRQLEAENRELKKALAEREETIDVLKKSVGIFSKR